MQEAKGNSWGKGKKGKVDKKPNIRYFYKYEMLPLLTGDGYSANVRDFLNKDSSGGNGEGIVISP